MQNIEVGKYFFGQPRRMTEGCRLDYSESGPQLSVILDGISKSEINKIRSGDMDLGVFEQEGILFLLVNIPGVLDWSDAPLHLGLYRTRPAIPDNIEDGMGLGLTVLGIEASTGMVNVIRFVGLGTDISRAITSILAAQGDTNQTEHTKKVKAIYRQYDCIKMVRMATQRWKVRAK